MYSVLKISALSEVGYLYVYTFHGKNTFPKDHHARLAIQSASDLEFIWDRHKALLQALDHYLLPMPYVVRTAEEVAFVYNE